MPDHKNAPTTAEHTRRKRSSAAAALALVPKAYKAFLWNDRSSAQAIGTSIADQLADTHPAVAKRLRDILGSSLRPTPLVACPADLVEVVEPRHGFDAVSLPADVLSQCREIVHEHARAPELAAFSLTPRHKVLLSGPPGNGKTMLAEALANEMDVPFLRVSHGGLVESYLGATGKNIDKLFKYARTAPCLVFIDEFDGIAIKRSIAGDVGEIRRVTNHLLIAIEQLPSWVTLVCATNEDQLIDEAIKRRFDFVIDIPSPTLELKLHCARRELHVCLTPGSDVSALAERVAALNLPNLFYVTERCRQIRRNLVLNNGAGIDELLRR